MATDETARRATLHAALTALLKGCICFGRARNLLRGAGYRTWADTIDAARTTALGELIATLQRALDPPRADEAGDGHGSTVHRGSAVGQCAR